MLEYQALQRSASWDCTSGSRGNVFSPFSATYHQPLPAQSRPCILHFPGWLHWLLHYFLLSLAHLQTHIGTQQRVGPPPSTKLFFPHLHNMSGFLWIPQLECGDGCRHAFRLMMILYAMFCILWIPLNLWMMPWHSLHIGQASNLLWLLCDSYTFADPQLAEKLGCAGLLVHQQVDL